MAAQVNNAAIGIPPNSGVKFGAFPKPSELDPDILKAVYETNVFAIVRVTNAMMPLLRQAPQGRIVNVSSVRGSLTAPEATSTLPFLPYSTSKTALNSMTKLYAKEFGDSGSPIKINAVCPGFCATDFNGFRGTSSAADGARIAIRMAMIPADGPNGGYFNDAGVLPW